MMVNDFYIEINFVQLWCDGFGLFIDDFGIGFLMLEYVWWILVYEMKVDQSFVCKIMISLVDWVIVELIVQMVYQFGCKIVVEGVEDVECFVMLCELGCDEVQGYFVGCFVIFDIFCKMFIEDVYCCVV